jgi:hypothetical protein
MFREFSAFSPFLYTIISQVHKLAPSVFINQLFEFFTPNDVDGDVYGFQLTPSETQDGGKCWELKSKL